jgi:hypothetical protein
VDSVAGLSGDNGVVNWLCVACCCINMLRVSLPPLSPRMTCLFIGCAVFPCITLVINKGSP